VQKVEPYHERLNPKRNPAISELTSKLLAQSRVIAKGDHIRDVQRLVDTYGGRKSKWVKKSSPRFEIGKELYEYHWYEHSGIGRVELRLKQTD